MIMAIRKIYCQRAKIPVQKQNSKAERQATERQATERETNIMQTDYIRVHSCGAVYYLSDSIYFDVLTKVGYPYYLKICIEEEEGDNVLLFRWDNIPDDIMQVYNYIVDKSYVGKNNTMLGPHINRSDGRIYALCKVPDGHIGSYVAIDDTIIPDYNAKFFSMLLKKMNDKKI